MKSYTLSGCVIVRDGKVLLLHKTKRGSYELPGGKVDSGETVEQAAIREAREEIGCDVVLGEKLPVISFQQPKKSFVSHRFLATTADEPRVMEPDVHDHFDWIAIAELDRYKLAPNLADLKSYLL